MKSVVVTFAGLAMIGTPLLAAVEKPPLMLEPSSNWNLNYADDSCRLARLFGTGDEKMFFSMDRYEPGDEFLLMVAGKPLADRRPERTEIHFGPGETGVIDRLNGGSLQSYSPALFSSSAKLIADPPSASEQRDDWDAERYLADRLAKAEGKIAPAVEASVTWVEATAKGKRPVRLNLGPMDKPMAALRGCTDELMSHWGIDVAAHRNLVRPAVPTESPGNWLTSRDYPTALLAKGYQGLVQVRLSVGPDGVPTQCHIQQSTRPAGFDDAVCKGLMRRARFEPAIGADGKPIASYWRSSVNFQIPN